MKTETTLTAYRPENVRLLLLDAALQLARLTGPALETYARTFAVLAEREADRICASMNHHTELVAMVDRLKDYVLADPVAANVLKEARALLARVNA